MPMKIEAIRQDFPVLNQRVNGRSLIYFDSAASMQKPRAVMDAMNHFYEHDYSNVHRGLHTLSERATALFEKSRETVRDFISASSLKEIIFVKGSTEGINLVASSYALPRLQKGDEIIISTLEHHANIVPWQVVCEKTGAHLKVIRVEDDGVLDQAHFQSLLSERTKILAITHVSNVLGTINPVKEMTEMAHKVGAVVLVDGAQAVQHMPVDVRDINCDFYVFSGHKCYGPTGIGVLYGKAALLEAMPPYQTGGDMVKHVTFEKTLYNDLPYKFEAGTPNIAGAIGLHAAIIYLKTLGFEAIQACERDLSQYLLLRLSQIEGLRIVGTAKDRASLVSFVMKEAHAHDVGTILDSEGIAVRAGHHCAMPLMDRFLVPSTVRASLAIYNTPAEIDVFIQALYRVKQVFCL